MTRGELVNYVTTGISPFLQWQSWIHENRDWDKYISSASSAVDHLVRQAVTSLAEAATLFTAAGKRLMAAGDASGAITLLSRACALLEGVDYPVLHSAALEALLAAQVSAGEARMARAITAKVDELECAGLDPEAVALLRIQLALADALACEPAHGVTRVQEARALLAGRGNDVIGLALDAAECRLLAQIPGHRRAARRLAYQVIALAGDGAHPAAASCGWEILGTIARLSNPAESTACFRQAHLFAQQHGLPFRRLHAQLELGVDEWIVKGETRRLMVTQREAARGRVLPVAGTAEILIAMDLVIRGRHADAAHRIDRCQAAASQAGLTTVLYLTLLARSVLAAHQGKRADMAAALGELAGAPHLLPLARLLGGTVGALLEEDAEQAARDLDQAAFLDREQASPFPVTGWDGLRLLLGQDPASCAGLAGPEAEADPAGVPFWSRPFALLGRAVLLGSRGFGMEAADIVLRAEQAAAPYSLLHHLGLRLIAGVALRDGWGAPAAWLRRAEAYFTQFPAPAVASACRALLRKTGAAAPQHRQGTGRIPGDIRSLGVTAREFEVLEALVGGRANKDIAQLLYISPRTVEKHIASLIVKSGLPDRKALEGLALGCGP